MTREWFQALQCAFLGNNEAVTQIRQRNYGIAITVLTKVLRDCQDIIRESGIVDDTDDSIHTGGSIALLDLDRCMKTKSSFLNDNDNSPGEKDDDADNFDEETHHDQPNLCESVVFHTDKHPHQEKKRRKVCGYYLYEKPIELPPYFFDEEEKLWRCPIPSVCTFLSSVVTFNMALAHQLAAYSTIPSEQQASPLSQHRVVEDGFYKTMLHKATRLYEICVTLQEERNQSDISLFDIAISNNLGIILMQSNDSTKAKECFQFALSAIMLLLNKSNGRNDSAHNGHGICHHDIDCFLHNASCTMRIALAAPAA